MKRNRKGFTLIELVIVIVIIGVLAVVAIPKYFSNVNKAKKAASLASLQAVREGINAYFANSGTAYPAFAAGAGGTIVTTIDGDTVHSVGVPATISYASTTLTNSVCTCTMDVNTGDGSCTGCV